MFAHCSLVGLFAYCSRFRAVNLDKAFCLHFRVLGPSCASFPGYVSAQVFRASGEAEGEAEVASKGGADFGLTPIGSRLLPSRKPSQIAILFRIMTGRLPDVELSNTQRNTDDDLVTKY